MMKKPFALSLLCLTICLASADAVAAPDSAEQLVADAFYRSANLNYDLGLVIEPRDPASLSAILLDAAVKLDKSNAEAWALRARIAKENADADAYDKAIVGYLATGINDDVARFDLINNRLNKLNTIDGKLTELESILKSDAGQAMSGPLRSRLAYEAAKYAANTGEDKALRRWAIEAARSDPSNHDAAMMMWKLVNELTDDRVKQGTATINMIRANPIDPGPRVILAQSLYQEFAYARAAQQFATVNNRLGLPPSEADLVSWAFSLAAIGEDEAALTMIASYEKALDKQAAPKDKPAEGADEAEKPAPASGKGLLASPFGIQLELLRLSLLDGEGEEEEAARSLQRLRKQLVEGESANDDSKELFAVASATLSKDLDAAQKAAEALKEGLPNRDYALGWIALRRGDAAKAITLFNKHEKDTRDTATVGLAFAKGQDAKGRARLVNEALKPSHTFVTRLAAARRLMDDKESITPTVAGNALLKLMTKYPSSFWLVDPERTPWIDVRMKVEPKKGGPLDPIIAEVQVWNISRFPLAINAQGPLAPYMYIVMQAQSAGVPTQYLPPVPVKLARSFVLKAGEKLLFDVRLDANLFGAIRAKRPDSSFIFSAKLVVNPVNNQGFIRSGLIGESFESRDTLSLSSPPKPQDIDAWVTDLAGKDEPKRLMAIYRLASLSSAAQPRVATPAVIAKANKALLQAWDAADEAEQAWIVLNTVGLADAGASFPELLKKAQQSESAVVWLALLSEQINDPESEVFSEGAGKKGDLDPVAKFAQAKRRVLKKIRKLNEEREAAGGE